MRNITLDNITRAVIEHCDGGKTHPRLYEVYVSLVKHLHAFVRDVRLTETELELWHRFLTEVGRSREQNPNGEVHMLMDLLGVSELAVLMNDEDRGAATEANNEGPLYVPNAPERKMGDRLGEDSAGEPLLLSGRVLNSGNQPIADALLDVWQPNSKGQYDVQDPSQSRGNFRGRFRTGADGRYEFETMLPGSYKVPEDGPCGEVLRLLGRHPWRPAHIHFKLSASGYVPITTMAYLEGAPYIDSDTTFSVKSAIIRPEKQRSPEALKDRRRDRSSFIAELDFVLKPIGS